MTVSNPRQPFSEARTIPKLIERYSRLGNGVLLAGLCLTLLGLTVLTGCAKGDKEDSSASRQEPQASQPVKNQPNKNDRLVGVWLGTASINESKLQGKLEQLAPEQRNGIIARAKSFLSTTMAVEYREDGSVENDLELVSVDGRLLRDGSVGTWQIVESQGESLLIETVEQHSDGTTSTNRFDYKFVGDGSKFVMAVPVSEDLQDCDATLEFKRVDLMPVNAPINVAEGDMQTQVK